MNVITAPCLLSKSPPVNFALPTERIIFVSSTKRHTQKGKNLHGVPESWPTSILNLHCRSQIYQVFHVCCFLRDEEEVGHLVLVQQVLVKETRQRRDKVRRQGDLVVLYLFQLPASTTTKLQNIAANRIVLNLQPWTLSGTIQSVPSQQTTSITSEHTGSVGDPWHFGADPDPRIHTSD